MKKTLILTMLLCAATVMADEMRIQTVLGYGPYSVNSAGEFTIIPVNFGINGRGYVPNVTSNVRDPREISFQTFCVEENERISQAQEYEAVESKVTDEGGQTLNLGVAWLYYQFATGVLENYNYDLLKNDAAGRQASAKLLQQDLWRMMAKQPGTSTFYNQAVAELGANWMNANNGTYPVAILNVWRNAGDRIGPIQDILILKGVPDGGVTLSLLGMGLASLGLISRRGRR